MQAHTYWTKVKKMGTRHSVGPLMATWKAQGIKIKTTNWAQWHTLIIPAWGNGCKRMRNFSSKTAACGSPRP